MLSDSCEQLAGAKKVHIMPCQMCCGEFPIVELTEISSGVSKKRNITAIVRLLKLAPKPIRRLLRQRVRETSVSELIKVIRISAAVFQQVCAHAAYAALLEPSLAMPFAFALQKAPSEYHDLILSTLLHPHAHGDENIFLFLCEVESIGAVAAVRAALERECMPIFRGKDRYCADNPSAPYVRQFLARLIKTDESSEARLFVARHQSLFASSEIESLSLIEEHVQSSDLELKCIGALQLSSLFPDSPDVLRLLWRTAELCALEANTRYSRLADGKFGSLVMQRIIENGSTTSTTEQREEALSRANHWCKTHIQSLAPVNRPLVESNIVRLYEAAECAPPKVIWFNSPEQASIAAGLHAQVTQLFVNHVKSPNCSKVQRYIWTLKQTLNALTKHVWEIHDWNDPRRVIDRSIDGRTKCVELLRGSNYWWQHRCFWDELALVNGRLANEVSLSHIDTAIDKLKTAYAAKGDASCLTFEPDSIHFKDLEFKLFWQIIFDEKRLGMVGFRSFLQWLGVYPFDDDGLEAILNNCGGFIPFDDIAIVVERPSKVHRNERNVLHNPDGLAVEYDDGAGIYAIDGVRVPARYITDPDTITLKDIEIEPNAEVRRVLIERFGAARFVAESDACVVDESEYGTLYKQEEERRRFAMVRVINRSPEPDGSFREYFLEVPPEMMTARQAVAWTFEMDEFEYQPQVET